MLASVAVVLVGLVVVAAGGYRLGRSGSTQASPYAVDTMLTIVLAVYAVGALALVGGTFWAGLETRRNPSLAAKKRGTASAVVAALLFLALVLGLANRFHLRINLANLHPPPAASTIVRTTQAPGANVPKARKPAPRQPQFQLIPFLAIVGAAGAAFAALVVAERRRKRRLPREPLVREELVEALDATLDDLRAETDARRAVISAYARMERVLASHGIARLRFEAPHEYLARVLADLTRRSRPAERLTELFERARFSTHEIQPAMKDDAIEAVEALQTELTLAEAEAAA
jgi:hypothetical protein